MFHLHSVMMQSFSSVLWQLYLSLKTLPLRQHYILCHCLSFATFFELIYSKFTLCPGPCLMCCVCFFEIFVKFGTLYLNFLSVWSLYFYFDLENCFDSIQLLGFVYLTMECYGLGYDQHFNFYYFKD